MRVERWFKVLVLGGAALGKACGGNEADAGGMKEPRPTAGAAPTDVDDGGSAATAGSATSGGSSGGTNAGASVGGAAALPGGNAGMASSGSAAGGSSGESSGGVSAGGVDAGVAGAGGADGQLECRIRENGLGHASDPCGCPCCWCVCVC